MDRLNPVPTNALFGKCYRVITQEMAQLLVRDVPDAVVAELQKRAARNGRSAEAEHRAILEQTLKPKHNDFWEEAPKLREELQRRGLHFDSAAIIRQDRDER